MLRVPTPMYGQEAHPVGASSELRCSFAVFGGKSPNTTLQIIYVRSIAIDGAVIAALAEVSEPSEVSIRNKLMRIAGRRRGVGCAHEPSRYIPHHSLVTCVVHSW